MTSAFEKNAEQLVLKLMAIPGASGEEGRVMEFIAARLRRAGAPEGSLRFDRAHRRSPLGGEVGNLVCKLPGTRRAGRRMLMAHADTVPLCRGARPVRRGRFIVPAGWIMSRSSSATTTRASSSPKEPLRTLAASRSGPSATAGSTPTG